MYNTYTPTQRNTHMCTDQSPTTHSNTHYNQCLLAMQISEEVSYVQDKMRQELEGQEEKHRQMVSELHQRHQRDLEMQIASLRHDLSRKEADLKQQLAELENR